MTDLLVDTNILIYAMDKSSAYHLAAKSILQNPNYKLFITTKNVSEFFAVSSKLKVELQTCLDFYREAKYNCFILFPSVSSLLLFENLVQQYNPKGNRVFDIEIVSVMLANDIHEIATFNQKDFIDIEEVKVLKPLQ